MSPHARHWLSLAAHHRRCEDAARDRGDTLVAGVHAAGAAAAEEAFRRTRNADLFVAGTLVVVAVLGLLAVFGPLLLALLGGRS